MVGHILHFQFLDCLNQRVCLFELCHPHDLQENLGAFRCRCLSLSAQTPDHENRHQRSKSLLQGREIGVCLDVIVRLLPKQFLKFPHEGQVNRFAPLLDFSSSVSIMNVLEFRKKREMRRWLDNQPRRRRQKKTKTYNRLIIFDRTLSVSPQYDFLKLSCEEEGGPNEALFVRCSWC